MSTFRAPKKFTDSSQSEITPEWKAWYAEVLLETADEIEGHLMARGEDPQIRFPERYDKDIGDGCWILVIEEPATEMLQRFRIPTPSLWWARPELNRHGSFQAGPKSRSVTVPGPYRVVIETPGGSLWLFPHEYVICNNPIPLITDPDCTIHPLGGRPSLDEEKQEQMFYLQSRGISYQDALLLIMDGVDMRDWGWVEFPEYARAMFEGVGVKPHFENARVVRV